MSQHLQSKQQKVEQKHSIRELLQTMEISVNKILSESEDSLFNLLQQLQNITDFVDNEIDEYKNSKCQLQSQSNIHIETQQRKRKNEDSFFISEVQTNENDFNIKVKTQQMPTNQSNQKMNNNMQKQQLEVPQKSQNYNKLQSGTIKIGQLQKKKQQLMKKLKAIDQQLYQANHYGSMGTLGNSSLTNIQGKAKKQNTALQHSRTLQILESFNNQKIRRHQKMIEKMKLRQQEELKKIEQLETRKIQIQLKRSRYVQQKTLKNKSQPKREMPKRQKLRG